MIMSCQTDSKKADQLLLENKFDEAIELYKKAADVGDSYAKWRLSQCYRYGYGVDFDENITLELLKQAAQEGCEEAKCDIAFAYMFDWLNIGEDVEKGKSILEELIKGTENPYVLCRYAGLLFFEGSPYEQNKEKAMRLLDKIKDKDNPYYNYAMGEVYLFGTDKIDMDIDKSIDFYTKAFNKGRRYSAYRLQSIYASGYNNAKKDLKKSVEWLNRGIESNQVDCMTEMGLLCLSEDSVVKDYNNPQRGIELLKKASLHGDGRAYFYLGNYYNEGKYLPKDDNKAFVNWEKSANLKYKDGYTNLAYCYLQGIGCEKDKQKAIELYDKAVEKGSGFSANKLYYSYYNGVDGVKKNNEKAKKYLLKAAELNDPWGCFNLANHYYDERGLMGKDIHQAFVYFKKAADMGLVEACGVMSYLYERGIGCDKDPDKAKEYKDMTIAKSEKEK